MYRKLSHKQDKIISSECRRRGDLFGFVPSYENERKVDMKDLLSNEYNRKWHRERNTHMRKLCLQGKKEFFLEEKMDPDFIQRRFVTVAKSEKTSKASKI